MKTLILTLLLLTACGRQDEVPPPPFEWTGPDDSSAYGDPGPKRQFKLGACAFLSDDEACDE